MTRTPEVTRAMERVRNGESLVAASRAEGCDPSGVSRACHAAGIRVAPRGRPRVKGAEDAALCVLTNGERVKVAAEREGVTPRTVYKRVAEMRARMGAAHA